MVSRWDNSPPFNGFTHTVLPLFEREPAGRQRRVRRRTTAPTGRSWSGSSTPATRRTRCRSPRCPLPPVEAFGRAAGASARTTCTRTCRCRPPGARRHRDLRHLLQRRRARLRHVQPVSSRRRSPISCRRRPRMSPTGAIQINDVFVDERGIVFTVDRFGGGLYILEADSDQPRAGPFRAPVPRPARDGAFRSSSSPASSAPARRR